MTTIVADPELAGELIARRRAMGVDRWDEVWDGAYIIMPPPDNLHQEILGRLLTVLDVAFGMRGEAKVRPGVNVTDRSVDWTENYRCPDVVVFLNDTQAVNQDTRWYGGPDFGVEVVSPGDRSREKLAFYAKVGTRELLIIDREPWQLELYRLTGDQMELVGTATAENETILESSVIPFRFALRPDKARPVIQIEHVPTRQEWLI